MPDRTTKLEDFPIYGELPREEIDPHARRFAVYFSRWLPHLCRVCHDKKWKCSLVNLIDIIRRVEKRRVYFHIFHPETKGMSELNELALYCFWILKLAPFSVEDEPDSGINTTAAWFLFMDVVYRLAQQNGTTLHINEDAARNLCYAFRYRDLSKEAIMALAESYVVPKSPSSAV
jgi:hypothetical protein